MAIKVSLLMLGYGLSVVAFVADLPAKIYTKASTSVILAEDASGNCNNCIHRCFSG